MTDKPTDTPESDAASMLAHVSERHTAVRMVLLPFAQRLEKERDEARAEIDRIKRNFGCARNQGTTQFCAEAVAARSELAQLKGTP